METFDIELVRAVPQAGRDMRCHFHGYAAELIRFSINGVSRVLELLLLVDVSLLLSSGTRARISVLGMRKKASGSVPGAPGGDNGGDVAVGQTKLGGLRTEG